MVVACSDPSVLGDVPGSGLVILTQRIVFFLESATDVGGGGWPRCWGCNHIAGFLQHPNSPALPMHTVSMEQHLNEMCPKRKSAIDTGGYQGHAVLDRGEGGQGDPPPPGPRQNPLLLGKDFCWGGEGGKAEGIRILAIGDEHHQLCVVDGGG